jgi:hypothetical protein
VGQHRVYVRAVCRCQAPNQFCLLLWQKPNVVQDLISICLTDDGALEREVRRRSHFHLHIILTFMLCLPAYQWIHKAGHLDGDIRLCSGTHLQSWLRIVMRVAHHVQCIWQSGTSQVCALSSPTCTSLTCLPEDRTHTPPDTTMEMPNRARNKRTAALLRSWCTSMLL